MAVLTLDRLQQLPLILAGPILRRTEPTAVTVWVALQQPCEVELGVYGTQFGTGQHVLGQDPIAPRPLLQGRRSTTAVGRYLHMVAVTAYPTAATLAEGRLDCLVPEQIYAYDLTFYPTAQSAPTEPLTLSQALRSPLHPDAPISYFDHQLPTFALPPVQLHQLRLAHGSCRKPHGGGQDTLVILDALIAQHCTDATDRPHQLFLTGDQIYGDDVGDPLLATLTTGGDLLLGWEEQLPIESNPSQPEAVTATLMPRDLRPGQRATVAEKLAGFTAGLGQPERAKSHLFSLGEYCALYLMTWSPVLWTELPTEPIDGSRPPRSWHQERRNLQSFSQSLWQVRRSLANIPTYMIFDDHDVTDDWYLNQAWCLRVLSRPLGRRTVQNAMIAYTLFQAWGNTPAQFVAGQPGHDLLTAIAQWSAADGKPMQALDRIQELLGIPAASLEGLPELEVDGEDWILKRSPATLTWNYRVDSPCHTVIVLDTRTWRGYPRGQGTDLPPVLLSSTAFDRQLRHPLQTAQPQLVPPVSQSPKATFVIAPTNLVHLEAIDRIQTWSLKQGKVFDHDVGDSWNVNKYALAKLLTTLFESTERLVILSGDIHYSAAVCLRFWRRSPSGEEIPHVLAQLTSSAVKNLEAKTLLVHTKLKNLLPERSQDWAGWDHLPDLWQVGRSPKGIAALQTVLAPLLGKLSSPKLTPLPTPTHLPFVQRLYAHHPYPVAAPWQIVVRQPDSLPDWRYHIDWILRQPACVAVERSSLSPSPSGIARWWQWVQGIWQNRWVQEGKEVVGVNNISLVQFGGLSAADPAATDPAATDPAATDPDSLQVIQDCYWYAPWRSNTVVRSRFEVPLTLTPAPPSLLLPPHSANRDGQNR